MPVAKCPKCSLVQHLVISIPLEEWLRRHSPDTKPGEVASVLCRKCWSKPIEDTPKELVARLKSWESQWSGHIQRTVLNGDSGVWVYVVVQSGIKWNPELDESLCDLDISVAQNPPPGVKHFNAMTIPPTTQEREDDFARRFLADVS